VAEWLEIAQWSQWFPQETTIALSNGASDDPLRPSSPPQKNGEFQLHPPEQTIQRVLPPGEYDRRAMSMTPFTNFCLALVFLLICRYYKNYTYLMTSVFTSPNSAIA